MLSWEYFFKQNRYFRVSFSFKSLNRSWTKTDNDGGHDHGNTSIVRPAQNVEDCPNVSMCRLPRGSGVTPVVSGHYITSCVLQTSEQFAVTTWRALYSDTWYIADTHYKYQTENENQKGWETQLSVRTTNKSWIVTIQNIRDIVSTIRTRRDMQV